MSVISSMPPGVIWLASFPKSGNTWLRILLANLFLSKEKPQDINEIPSYGNISSGRVSFEEITLLDSTLMSHEEIETLRPRVTEILLREMADPCWIKVHDAYTLTRLGEPVLGVNTARAAIYIVRDPRDVAVSFAYFLNISLDESIAILNKPNIALQVSQKGLSPQLRQKLCGWSGHINSWLSQKDFPVHVLRYEDLSRTPIETFRKVLDFLGGMVDMAEIERAVTYSSFSKLQEQELFQGFKEYPAKNSVPFFRSGKVGDWRQHLSEAQAKLIEEIHAEQMLHFGYL